MKQKILKFIFAFFLIPNFLIANTNTNYFQEGIILFNDKKFEKAKFKFEQDIVFNPKNEMAYLYLAKIFNNLNDKNLEERNLKTVILLNPKNEEAIYNLAKLKLESSDYEQSKKLNDRLTILCDEYCAKSKKLKIEIDTLSKK